MSERTIHTSPMPDVEIPAVSLTDYCFEQVAERADRVAMVEGPSGRTLTYAQLHDQIRALAGGLQARGFAKGDVLALLAPNVPEYAVVFHGVAMAGGAITTINPTYTAREMAHQIADAKPRFMVTTALFLDTAREASAGTTVEEVFVLGGTDVEGVRDAAELFGDPLAEQVPVEPDDVVALPYSSGTTGLSKGVMLTHRNLVANIAQSVAAGEVSDEESFVAALPFFHIYGMQVLMNSGLRSGATVITMPRFELETYLRLNAEHRCTRAYVAPPIVVALAKHPLVDQFDLEAMTTILSGAAPLSAETGEAAAARLGCEVAQGYGMTELSPVSHTTRPGGYKPGSVGVTLPNTETMIVDPGTGESVGLDVDGELWVRGPQVMAGYLGRQEDSDATVDRDGWLHTGDIAHIDADGHVYVVDRLKELIKYKGFQVPPAELESVLLTHESISDAAVVGLPDEEAGEIPVGFVVLTPGAELSPEDVQEFVAGQVARYKRLGHVVIVEEIPKSAAGKILRRVLRENAASA